jgi:hypothetical protein
VGGDDVSAVVFSAACAGDRKKSWRRFALKGSRPTKPVFGIVGGTASAGAMAAGPNLGNGSIFLTTMETT